VLGLPRGGVPVAYEIARALHLPLDVVVVCKVVVASAPWVTLGAVGEDGAAVVDVTAVASCPDGVTALAAAQRWARIEVARRVALLDPVRPRTPLAGRTAIVVGGSTARAACQVARGLGASRVVVAAPVAFPVAVTAVRSVADEVVSLPHTVRHPAAGMYYGDFAPVTDDEVIGLLKRASHRGRLLSGRQDDIGSQ
jgi:putative phosphoribosyl transferase